MSDDALTCKEAAQLLRRRDTGEPIRPVTIRTYIHRGLLSEHPKTVRDPGTGMVLRYYVSRAEVEQLRANMHGGPGIGRPQGRQSSTDVRLMNRDARDGLALDCFKRVGPTGLTSGELATVLDISAGSAYTTILRLRELDLVVPHSSRTYVYVLKETDNDQ